MIILTGGAGFIGSCFLKKLNDNNIFDVLVVDRLGTGEKWKNLVGKRFKKYEHKDVFREKIQNEEYGDIDAIVHLGACTVTTEKDADYLLDNNLTYSIELAEFAEWNDIRFIYASSAATYGSGNLGYSDSEFHNLKPLNIYGLSKHLFDLWVIDNKLDSSFTGLKFFNVFGPNEYHKGEMASMVYKAFRQITATGKVHLFKSYDKDYKDGEQKRDFVYAKDVTEILWNILNLKDFSGIYNLGSGTAKTWNELVEAVFTALNMTPKIEYIEMPEDLKNQYQYYTKADIEKLKDTECPVLFKSLEENVSDYVQNFLNNDRQYL